MALLKSFSDLPDEVLLKIQEFLTTKNEGFMKDLRNLTLASKEFDRISHPDKPLWLMWKVFPLLFKYISKQDVFSVRIVCQEWRDAIDKYLGEPWGLLPYNGTDNNSAVFHNCNSPLILKGLKDVMRFQLSAEILDFIEKTVDHARDGRNPVLTRSLALLPVVPDREQWGFGGLEELVEFYGLAQQLLQKFGTHIHYLVFGNDESFEPTSLFLYDVLRQVLQLCPNLRSLEVKGKAFEFKKRFCRKDLLYTMGQKRLPPLPHLECLFSSLQVELIKRRGKLETVSSPLSDVLYSTYSHQLTKLGVVTRDLKWITEEIQEFPKLTELNLEVNDGLSNLKFMEALSLSTVGKLTLSGKLQLNELLELLGMFPDLKVLDLGRLVVGDVISAVSPAPSLCSISLNLGPVHNHCFFMNFPFLHLRYLNLTYDLGTIQKSGTQEGSSGTVEDPFKLSECLVAGTLSTCPIWDNFQKLKEIQATEVKGCVSRKVYTRETFELKKKLTHELKLFK